MAKKQSKNQYRRAVKKARRLEAQQQSNGDHPQDSADGPVVDEHVANDDAAEAVKPPNGDVVMEKEESEDEGRDDDQFNDPSHPLHDMYRQISKRFATAAGDAQPDEATDGGPALPHVYFGDDDDDIPDEDATAKKLSRKKLKKLNRPTVAQLKLAAKNPESVQWWDIDSPDPYLLLKIKETKNTVPVPDHWNVKREYLSSKRGIEKPQFKLPKFIADTGIAEMRDAQLEKEAEKTLKQKQRDRVQPKMGRMDIDYQKLHDAFFKFQVKPPLSRFGEVYFEGKELEAKTMNFKPGIMSEELKEALGMPVGAPLPWLLTMQKIGPPPAFPGMEIAGLNAPIPPGASWGYAPGQFGKPTLDEFNRPMWGGDVFGVYKDPEAYVNPAEHIDKSYWGIIKTELEDEEEEEEDSDEEEDEDEVMSEEQEEKPEIRRPAQFQDVSGESVFPSRASVRVNPDAEHSGSLYQVIGEQESRISGFMGSSKKYDLKNPHMPVLGEDDIDSSTMRAAGEHDISIDVDALTRDDYLSKEQVEKQYEASRNDEMVRGLASLGRAQSKAAKQRIGLQRMEPWRPGRRRGHDR